MMESYLAWYISLTSGGSVYLQIFGSRNYVEDFAKKVCPEGYEFQSLLD